MKGSIDLLPCVILQKDGMFSIVYFSSTRKLRLLRDIDRAVFGHDPDESWNSMGDVLLAEWIDRLSIRDDDALVEWEAKHGLPEEEIFFIIHKGARQNRGFTTARDYDIIQTNLSGKEPAQIHGRRQ